MMRNIVVVLHNVQSVQRVIETAKICYGLGYNTLVISKAIGTAAQTGVPEANKIAMRLGKRLLCVPDIQDAIDLLKPDKVFLYAPKPYAKNVFNPKKIIDEIGQGNLVLMVFGGLEPGLSSRELSLGESFHLDLPGNIGSIGALSIVLYLLYCYLNLSANCRQPFDS